MSEEIGILVPQNVLADKIISVVDRAIVDLGLTAAMRGSLKSYPGSTHWHLKRGIARGTLEITWWPEERRLWIKIQSGRKAPWIDEITPRFKREIESRLKKDAAR
jgi:hypothetical protein